MKLLIAILNNNDAPDVCHGLLHAGFPVTRFPVSGGFLKAGSQVILTPLEAPQIDTAMIIIRENSQSRVHSAMPRTEASAKESAAKADSGAVVFVLPVDRFESF